MLHRLAAQLPEPWQRSLRKRYYGWQIRRGTFQSKEREYQELPALLKEGDWALDIGANIGHYTQSMSNIVGNSGRIFACEPVPSTFDLLTANVRHFRWQNVTLLNLAASDHNGLVRMEIPAAADGSRDYLGHLARMNAQAQGPEVFCCRIDNFSFTHRIALVKIDTEGAELAVLQGMERRSRSTCPR
jgi:FkbM family methyltransferase